MPPQGPLSAGVGAGVQSENSTEPNLEARLLGTGRRWCVHLLWPVQAPEASVPCAFVSCDTMGGFLSP